MKLVKVSIVIPVYNEGEHLAACLSAIARQSVAPYEVIVVNNNSTDTSVAVAKGYPSVTVIDEKRQGVVFARDTGFSAARGDIIGRIDADTIISDDWVETVQQLFSDQLKPIDALSGAVSYHDMPWKAFIGRLDLVFRQWIANGMDDQVYLYGANMAIRRSTWYKVRHSVCRRGGIHEDFDLAIHLAALGATVVFDQRLKAAVSLRRFDVGFLNFWQYAWLNPRTYLVHGKRAEPRMYTVIALVITNFYAIQMVYRSYDATTDRLALANLFNQRPHLRVNPATFVD